MAQAYKSRRELVLRLFGSRVGTMLHACRWAARMSRYADPATWAADHCLLDRYVSPGDVCVDIGASGGDWTYPMAKRVGRDGLVHAFDAFPYYAKVLRRALWIRRVRNVKVHAVGLGDADENRELTVVDASGRALTGEVHLTPNGETPRRKVDVPVRKLDTIMAQDDSFSRTVLVKIDVEGAELAIFRGAKQMLEGVRPVIYCEIVDGFCRRYGHGLLDVLNFVVDAGYRTFGLTDQNELTAIEPSTGVPSGNFLFLPK